MALSLLKKQTSFLCHFSKGLKGQEAEGSGTSKASGIRLESSFQSQGLRFLRLRNAPKTIPDISAYTSQTSADKPALEKGACEPESLGRADVMFSSVPGCVDVE
ncbi:hypothetical protein SRHO_G00105440 [Serrasalmus rhombeus]